MEREHDRRNDKGAFGKKRDKEHRDQEKHQPAPGGPGEQDPRHRQAPGRGQDVPPVHGGREGRDDRPAESE